jgi:hypothetical protein
MTDNRSLDRALDAFLADGVDRLADRVLEAALIQIDHTQQRRRLSVPWRFPTMTFQTRVAAAAVIGVLAIGGALYLLRPPTFGQPTTTPSPSPAASPAAWTLTGAPSIDHSIRAVTVGLLDGRVLLAGGGLAAGPVAEVYDPPAGTWSVTGPMKAARSYPIAVRLADGKVLVAGGDDGRKNLDNAEIFDPATGQWTTTGSMTHARQQAFASSLADGRVLVAGGGTNEGLLDTAEIYDPRTGTWNTTGNMPAGRAGPLSAILLGDGRVLVTGGFADDQRSAELYDPVTGTWTETSQMAAAKVDEQTGLVLRDGRVLIVGGNPPSAEVFDPSAATWTTTSPLAGRHSDLLVSALLTDGSVLLVGGTGATGLAGEKAGSETFNPVTGRWIGAGFLNDSLYVRSATLLADGSVLVVGSSGPAVGTPFAEVFKLAS